MSTAGKPFVVLYRWTVAEDREEAFRERWREGTLRLRDQYGGLGSCLTRTADGDFIAIALWPSEEARAAAFAARGPTTPWPGVIRFEETPTWVEDDLWKVSAFTARA